MSRSPARNWASAVISSAEGRHALSGAVSGASITGAFYFPYGTFAMNGGASVGSGGCLELIAAQVNILQGTAVGTVCVGLVANPQKVVDEGSKVSLTDPKSPVFTWPNTISAAEHARKHHRDT